jgi:hypothetical protein
MGNGTRVISPDGLEENSNERGISGGRRQAGPCPVEMKDVGSMIIEKEFWQKWRF